MIIGIRKLIYLCCTISTLSSCYEIKGNGDFVEKELDYSGFKKVAISIPANVQYHLSDNYKFQIKGESNLLEELDIYISHDELNIELHDSWFQKLNITEPFSIQISSPQLYKIQASNSSNIVIKEEIKNSQFECKLSGASSLYIERLSVDQFKANISSAASCHINTITANDAIIKSSGASNLTFKNSQIDNLQSKLSGAAEVQIESGTNENMNLKLSGASSWKSPQLMSKDITIATSGGSNAQIQANNSLMGKASGGSSIYYYGIENHSIKTNGGASVKSLFLGGGNSNFQSLQKETEEDYDAIDAE